MGAHVFFCVVLEVPPFTAIGVEAGFAHYFAEDLSVVVGFLA